MIPGPTERLEWRIWRTDDLELATGLWGDPEVGRYISNGGRFTPDAIRERLGRELESAATDGIQYWPLFMRADGAFVGCCGLRPYRREARIEEFGVHIRPTFWRRGLALEAARAVIEHAFVTRRVEALFAGHHPHNVSSRDMLTKLGFRYARDELYAATGLMHPSYLLSRPAR